MTVRINVHATVHTPMYAIDKRMYMKLKLDDISRQKLDDHHNKEAAKYMFYRVLWIIYTGHVLETFFNFIRRKSGLKKIFSNNNKPCQEVYHS